MINYYTVKTGETITDVCLNATGTLANWEDILNANGFTDWVPELSPGQQIIIPDGAEIQNNVLQITEKYPANNDLGIPNFDDLVNDLIATFEGYSLFRADDNMNAKADSTLLTADINI
jgi:phage tail protein X